MVSVAVVEDNPELLTDLVEFLNLLGFQAQGFASAEAFFSTWPATTFSLILLDVVLPGANGFDIAQQVRAQDERVGIVMLTAMDSNDDQVQGLNTGADIYLSKRSSLDVIEAACRSVLRRLDSVDTSAAEQPLWTLHTLCWQLQAPNGVSLDLTQAESALLAALFEKPGQSVSRELLLLHLGKPETLSNLRNLDNTASRLRRKVQSVCDEEFPIRPSYGKGYVFVGQCAMSA